MAQKSLKHQGVTQVRREAGLFPTHPVKLSDEATVPAQTPNAAFRTDAEAVDSALHRIPDSQRLLRCSVCTVLSC